MMTNYTLVRGITTGSALNLSNPFVIKTSTNTESHSDVRLDIVAAVISTSWTEQTYGTTAQGKELIKLGHESHKVYYVIINHVDGNYEKIH